MSSVPLDDEQRRARRRPIDRTRPPYKDDPVLAVLTDEQYHAFVEVLVRLARSAADAELRRRMAAETDASTQPDAAPERKPRRKRRPAPSPSRLATWEAQWQADAAEADS